MPTRGTPHGPVGQETGTVSIGKLGAHPGGSWEESCPSWTLGAGGRGHPLPSAGRSGARTAQQLGRGLGDRLYLLPRGVST